MKESNIQKLFQSELVAVNIGPRLFGEALEKQDVQVVYVDWKPVAGGDSHMKELLDELGGF